MTKKSSFFRLDEQVFFTLGAVCVLSLVVMAFRFASSTPCAPVKIAVNSQALLTGNIIRFNAETQKGKTFSWNFGDGTVKEEEISVTNHVYRNAGRYTITVLVNDQCTDMQDIVIGDAPIVVNTNLQPIIKAFPSDTAYVNQPVQFSDISPGSTKWEWRFGQTSSIDANDRSPVYTYTVPGRKAIRLRVNDRSDLVVPYSILVLEKPVDKPTQKPKEAQRVAPPIIIHEQPHTEPLKNPSQTEVKPEPIKEKPKAPAITSPQLEILIKEVCAGTKSSADFLPYMCGKTTFQVIYNNDVMSLEKMCDELKGIKVKKIKTLNIIPTINDNCLSSINVTLKKKGLLF